MRDISERKEVEKAIYQLAFHDSSDQSSKSTFVYESAS